MSPRPPDPAAGDFGTLVQPPAGGTTEHPIPAPDTDRPPDPPGFGLQDEVGRGGMGFIYRAHDLALDRDVAVKLLRPNFPPDGATARRFEAEARITARLQHPGIPAVYHVGRLGDGRPFLAMKLIHGDTLADLMKRPDADRGRQVATFEDIAQAVGYAHSQGVIHRDLKPANVMVGAFGEVQVMDWGLAKELGRAEAFGPADRSAVDLMADGSFGPVPTHASRDTSTETRAGQVLGTPAYMAPEQAAGAVDKMDARTDVFGLGAVLCHLLTGKPPFVGEDAFSTHDRAVRADLADAFARLDGCGADPDLVALCKRCLSADPAGRPADGGAVAAAVAELRAAAVDRARRAELSVAEETVRRRLQLRLGGLAAAVLLAGAGVSAWQAVRATTAEHATAAQLDRTRDAEAEARKEAENARTAGAVAVAEGERAKREEGKARAGEARAKTAEAEAKEAEGRARTAAVKARAEEQKARESEQRAKQEELRAVKAEVLALTESDRAKQEEAKARAAAELAGKRETEAVAAAADTRAFSDFLTGKILAAARPAGQQGGVGKDVKLSEALRAAEADLDKQFAGRPVAEAAARHALGVTWRNLGEYDRALAHLTRAVELRRANLPPDHLDTLTSMSSLSVLLQQQGKPDEAIALARKALDGRRRALGPTDPATLTSVNNLALLLRQRGDTAAAEPLLVEVVEGRRKTLGDTAPDTLTAVVNLATLYLQANELAKAEPLLVEAVAGLRKAGDTTPDTLVAVHNLAELYTRQKRYEAAEPLHREAVVGAKKALPDGHPMTFTYQAGLGRMLRASGKPAEAEPHLLAAYAGLKGQPAHRGTVREVVQALIDLYTAANRPADAAAWKAKLADVPPP